MCGKTRKAIAQVAQGFGRANEDTLGNWCAQERARAGGAECLSAGDVEELKRLRGENAELRMERDVLKRSRG